MSDKLLGWNSRRAAQDDSVGKVYLFGKSLEGLKKNAGLILGDILSKAEKEAAVTYIQPLKDIIDSAPLSRDPILHYLFGGGGSNKPSVDSILDFYEETALNHQEGQPFVDLCFMLNAPERAQRFAIANERAFDLVDIYNERSASNGAAEQVSSSILKQVSIVANLFIAEALAENGDSPEIMAQFDESRVLTSLVCDSFLADTTTSIEQFLYLWNAGYHWDSYILFSYMHPDSEVTSVIRRMFDQTLSAINIGTVVCRDFLANANGAEESTLFNADYLNRIDPILCYRAIKIDAVKNYNNPDKFLKLKNRANMGDYLRSVLMNAVVRFESKCAPLILKDLMTFESSVELRDIFEEMFPSMQRLFFDRCFNIFCDSFEMIVHSAGIAKSKRCSIIEDSSNGMAGYFIEEWIKKGYFEIPATVEDIAPKHILNILDLLCLQNIPDLAKNYMDNFTLLAFTNAAISLATDLLIPQPISRYTLLLNRIRLSPEVANRINSFLLAKLPAESSDPAFAKLLQRFKFIVRDGTEYTVAYLEAHAKSHGTAHVVNTSDRASSVLSPTTMVNTTGLRSMNFSPKGMTGQSVAGPPAFTPRPVTSENNFANTSPVNSLPQRSQSTDVALDSLQPHRNNSRSRWNQTPDTRVNPSFSSSNTSCRYLSKPMKSYSNQGFLTSGQTSNQQSALSASTHPSGRIDVLPYLAPVNTMPANSIISDDFDNSERKLNTMYDSSKKEDKALYTSDSETLFSSETKHSDVEHKSTVECLSDVSISGDVVVQVELNTTCSEMPCHPNINKEEALQVESDISNVLLPTLEKLAPPNLESGDSVDIRDINVGNKSDERGPYDMEGPFVAKQVNWSSVPRPLPNDSVGSVDGDYEALCSGAPVAAVNTSDSNPSRGDKLGDVSDSQQTGFVKHNEDNMNVSSTAIVNSKDSHTESSVEEEFISAKTSQKFANVEEYNEQTNPRIVLVDQVLESVEPCALSDSNQEGNGELSNCVLSTTLPDNSEGDATSPVLVADPHDQVGKSVLDSLLDYGSPSQSFDKNDHNKVSEMAAEISECCDNQPNPPASQTVITENATNSFVHASDFGGQERIEQPVVQVNNIQEAATISLQHSNEIHGVVEPEINVSVDLVTESHDKNDLIASTVFEAVLPVACDLSKQNENECTMEVVDDIPLDNFATGGFDDPPADCGFGSSSNSGTGSFGGGSSGGIGNGGFRGGESRGGRGDYRGGRGGESRGGRGGRGDFRGGRGRY